MLWDGAFLGQRPATWVGTQTHSPSTLQRLHGHSLYLEFYCVVANESVQVPMQNTCSGKGEHLF